MTVEIQRAPYAGWRALAATVLVMSGALGAHTWAGGHVPDGSVPVALGALVLGASLLVLRGTARARHLLPLLGLAQLGLHASFSTTLVSGAEHAGHAAHGEAASTWTWQMLLAHTAVTLLTALVWHLCSRAGHVVLTLVQYAAAQVRPTARRIAATPVPPVRPLGVLLDVSPRRGPPVARAA